MNSIAKELFRELSEENDVKLLEKVLKFYKGEKQRTERRIEESVYKAKLTKENLMTSNLYQKQNQEVWMLIEGYEGIAEVSLQ